IIKVTPGVRPCPTVVQPAASSLPVTNPEGFRNPGIAHPVPRNAKTDRVRSAKYVTRQAARYRIGRSHPTRTTGAAYGTDLESAAGDPRRPIAARLPAAVSPPGGLEASAPRPPRGAQGDPLGLPPPGPRRPGHDLVRRRQHPRAVRDGPRHRRALPPQA